MVILGLNGRNDATHDPAAAIVIDGAVVAFVEEERLSRVKRATGQFPHNAVRAVLSTAGLDPEDVDLVTYGWDIHRFDSLRGIQTMLGTGQDIVRTLTGVPINAPLEFVAHHDAHAASAFCASDFTHAGIVVVDGEGEDAAISLYVGDRQAGIRRIQSFGRGTSLGFLFEAASVFCGFGRMAPGKVMGLAAYGESHGLSLGLEFREGELVSPFRDGSETDEIIKGWCVRFDQCVSARRGARQDEGMPLNWSKVAVAAAVQETARAIIDELVSVVCRHSGSRNVCLAGGVALNCVENGRIVSQGVRLFVPSAPHDAGVAVGSALWMLRGSEVNARRAARADLGPCYGRREIVSAAKRLRLPIRQINPFEEAARRLVDGEIVGWFQGRMEAGPRALGMRSILALGAESGQADALNDLKQRERWRPFGLTVLDEAVGEIVGLEVASPFMNVALPATERARRLRPAGIHVDGSTRIQTVARKGSPLGALLEQLESHAEVPVVVNTSFNAAGQPIVCTPDEALRAGVEIGLAAVVADDFLIEVSHAR